MKIAITGANGFIGKYVVEHALTQGFQVLALVRSEAPVSWQDRDCLTIVQCNLLQPKNLDSTLCDCNLVVHLAAVISGNNFTQYTQTIAASKNLLTAMDIANVKKLIALSSISVLDYVNQETMTLIDENTPINLNDTELGFYALMKRDQENIYQQWQNSSDKEFAILRPGVVYNEHHLSSDYVGYIKGFIGLSALHNGHIPVVHVKSVATAVIAMANKTQLNNDTIHITNNNLPTQNFYIKTLKARGNVRILIPIPWYLYSFLSTFIRFAISIIGKSSKIPDSFRKNSVAARQKPFNFSNEKAKRILGWKPVTKIN